ncbi:MAG TPA: hypothetical protein VGN88_03740 [Phycisphaerae bacterium]
MVGLFDGRIPNSTQFQSAARVSLPVIFKTFGTYAKALAEAGFTYKKRTYSTARRRFKPEQVLANLREVLARSDGYEFTFDFYCKNGGLFKSQESIRSYLGLGWEDALERAGAKKREKHAQNSQHADRLRFLAKITREELLAELDSAWQRKDGYPTRAEFNRCSKVLNAQFVVSRFGSWSNAIRALCEWKKIAMPRISGTGDSKLPPRDFRIPITKHDLLADLRRVHQERPSLPMSITLYKSSNGKYSKDTFKNHFGSWRNAVRAVGSEPGSVNYSDDELFDEMQRIWEKLGR